MASLVRMMGSLSLHWERPLYSFKFQLSSHFYSFRFKDSLTFFAHFLVHIYFSDQVQSHQTSWKEIWAKNGFNGVRNHGVAVIRNHDDWIEIMMQRSATCRIGTRRDESAVLFISFHCFSLLFNAFHWFFFISFVTTNFYFMHTRVTLCNEL